MAAKSVEEIKAEVTALVKSQGNQGAISLGTVLDDITELAGEGGGGGDDATTIGGIPVFRVDGILNTLAGVTGASGPLKQPNIAAEIYAQVGTDEFLVVSNCEYTDDVSSINIEGNIGSVPGVARGRFVPYEDDGQTVVETYVTFVGSQMNNSHKAVVATYGLYLNAQNGSEGVDSYAYWNYETSV